MMTARPALSPLKYWGFRLIASGVPIVLGIIGAAIILARHWAARSDAIYLQEPGYEKTGHKYLYDPLLGWKNIPNWQATTHGKQLTINSFGLRGPECAYEKPEGISRVLLLGDSYVWGYGVADDKLLTVKLEQLLNEESKRFQVLNAGVSGWGTDQELLYLKNDGFKFTPQIVVLAFFIVNDPINNSRSQQYGLYKPVFLDSRLTIAGVPVPKPGSGAPVFASQADLFHITIALLREMAKECQQHDCQLVVMKFGNFLRENDPTFEALSQWFSTAIADDSGIPYLDVDAQYAARNITATELLRGNDDGHWNAYGHQVSASILHEFLVERELLRSKAANQK